MNGGFRPSKAGSGLRCSYGVVHLCLKSTRNAAMNESGCRIAAEREWPAAQLNAVPLCLESQRSCATNLPELRSDEVGAGSLELSSRSSPRQLYYGALDLKFCPFASHILATGGGSTPLRSVTSALWGCGAMGRGVHFWDKVSPLI